MRTMKGGDMKRLLVSIFVITAVFVFQHNALAAAASRIGIINIQRCISESSEGKRISESLQKEIKTMQQKYDKAQKELVELQKEIEKQSLMLSLDAKETKQKEYNKKSRELNYLNQDLSEEANKAEQNARIRVLQVLNVIVKNIAQQDSYDLILESSTAGVLFASEGLDITDQVIKELNKLKP
jgi:outer membrane protein